jgi:hypothetical protein
MLLSPEKKEKRLAVRLFSRHNAEHLGESKRCETGDLG